MAEAARSRSPADGVLHPEQEQPNRSQSQVSGSVPGSSTSEPESVEAIPVVTASSSQETSTGDDDAEVVFGVPINDVKLEKAFRRVILLSVIAAAFHTIQFVIDLLSGAHRERDLMGLWGALSSLMLELSIPACGYYGALRSNRQLLCCFCGCNLFIALMTLMTLIRLELRVVDGNCDLESNSQQRRTCELWAGDSPEKHLMLFRMAAVVCIGCLAFFAGNRLYQRIAHNHLSMPQQPVVGQVTTPWPARHSSTRQNSATTPWHARYSSPGINSPVMETSVIGQPQPATRGSATSANPNRVEVTPASS